MIKFLDLQKITAKYADEIHEAVNRVVDSGWYLQGSENERFEANYSAYIGTKYTIGCANGLDALIWIFRAYIEMGIMKPGDEVIVPANTYIASILAISENGLKPVLVEPDITTYQIDENKIEAVLNFAGYKAVGESVKKPLEYYENNISGALVLLETMRKYNVKKFIFSSSATVYGEPERIPLTEDCKIGGTTNPYGTTKLFIEQILQDLYKSDNTWDIAILRYFNPVGAHESGLIGEEPQGIPNNLMPYIVRVASGELEQLSIFGNDYNTPDGTGVRDYIHVVDLAKGHIKALEKLEKENSGIYIYNLGTGVGYSVLDMVKAFEESTGKKVNYKIVERRAGDIATCYSDPQKAKNELHWEATKTLNDMCKDSWKYIQNRKK